jgi:hypothetical protein
MTARGLYKLLFIEPITKPGTPWRRSFGQLLLKKEGKTMKLSLKVFLSAFALVLLVFTAANADECLECHADETPGIVKQWQDSKHPGVNVGCKSCHTKK